MTFALSNDCPLARMTKPCVTSKGFSSAGASQYGKIRALGVASFGPLDLRTQSHTYGFVTSTAKAGWRNSDVARRLERRFGLPVGFDTDVNGAALAEGRWGAGVGLTDFAYVTVGTGIGVGTVVGGKTVFGLNHTELGHIRVARRAGDSFAGICAFHGDCVEGLASGPAIEARAGMPASSSQWIILSGIALPTTLVSSCTPWC